MLFTYFGNVHEFSFLKDAVLTIYILKVDIIQCFILLWKIAIWINQNVIKYDGHDLNKSLFNNLAYSNV